MNEKDSEKHKYSDGKCETACESNHWSLCTLYSGIVYASISGLSFSFSSVIVKYIKSASSMQLTFFRFSCILVMSLSFAIHSRGSLFGCKNSRVMFHLTAIFGILASFFTFISIKYLPIADATVICFSYPVVVTIAAKLFLKEPFGYFQVVASLLTVIGVALISKVFTTIPDDVKMVEKYDHIYGISAAVSSIVFYTGYNVSFRKMRNANNYVMLFTSGWIGTFFTGAIFYTTHTFTYPSCGLESWLLLCVGIFSFFALMFLQLGLSVENAGPIATIRAACDIVSVYLWQIFFFNEIPDSFSISGALLVCSCILIISTEKLITSLPDDSQVKNVQKFILKKLRK